jgi:hypothetical protein
LKTNFTLLNGVVISHFFLPLASHSNFSVSSPEPVDALGRRLDFFCCAEWLYYYLKK